MLDSLGNIMVTIATGIAVLVVGLIALFFIDGWLEKKAGKPFLSFGVVGTMAVASVFWWGGWWWQSAAAQSGQNENYGYGLVAVAGALALAIIWRNFTNTKWTWAVLGSALQIAIAWHFSGALALLAIIAVFGGVPGGGGSRSRAGSVEQNRTVYINRTEF